jgi:hypothetical protein
MAPSELQELLAGNIHLLPGAQINRDNPRRWLLIRREAGVPDHDGGGGWWSVDHLAVDQDAVPTCVEVKRASDTRLGARWSRRCWTRRPTGPRSGLPSSCVPGLRATT